MTFPARPLAPILPRLEQLVPRLGSNHDGEVVATVRAIGRTLAGAGADWHDLTAALRPPAAPHPRPAPGGEDLCATADWCARHVRLLAPREADFVTKMASLLHRARPVSPKQRAWLVNIHAALRARTARPAP